MSTLDGTGRPGTRPGIDDAGTGRGPRTAAGNTSTVVGRGAEIARLGELLEADTPVMVIGEPGIGKTTVARAAAAASGRTVFEGGGLGTLSWVPLLPLERAMGRSLDSSDPATVATDLTRTIGAGILFVDDLQWVDPATLRVVELLAGRVGLVLALRASDPAASAVLETLASIERLPLDGLAAEAATIVIRRAHPAADASTTRRMVERAGGNPLLLEELARSRSDDASLASIVRQRLFALQPGTREAMVTLALAGRPLGLEVLGPAGSALVEAELARAEADGRLRVRHDLLGEAAIEGTAVDERRRIHRRLALLAESPGDAARHHLAAGEREDALRSARAAADAATQPEERGAHLALAAQAADGEAAIDLLFEAVDAMCDGSGEVAAVELLRPVLATVSLTPRRARIAARALRDVADLDGAREAVARGQEALESMSRDQPGVLADDIGLQLEAAQNAEWELDLAAEAVRLATAAEALASRHGIEAIKAKFVLGEARCLADDLRGLADLEEAMTAAFDAGDLTLAFTAADSLAFELLKSGRATEGHAMTQALRARAHVLGRADAERNLGYWEIGFGWHSGRFAETLVLAEARDALAIPGETGWYLAQLLIDAGRFPEARVRVERIVAEAQPGEFSLGGALWLLAELELWSGRHRAAVAAADRHARDVPGAGHRLFIEVAGAWARYELGEPPTWPAMPALRAMTEGAEIELEALRALASGEPILAAARFTASADAWAGRHARGELRTRWAAGESHRQAGDDSEARALLLALEERLEDSGGRTLLARVRRSLRLLGIRRTAEAAPDPGSELSGRERQILDLVAAGLRDREIAAQLGLSRWSVVRAVESASGKLGANTRAEAVAALVR